MVLVSQIQFHIEKIKEICTEIRDMKRKHKSERHKKDKHDKTTSPSTRINKIYKYKAGNKGIHDQHAQGYTYSTYGRDSHQKFHNGMRNSCHIYGKYPTQKLSSLTPV
jgi:hypothetical protein